MSKQQVSVLITGAARGIGRAIARELAAEGWRLLLHCHRSEAALADFCSELKTAGADFRRYCVDLAEPEGPARLLRQLREDGETPAALVNNAGVSEWGLFTDLSEDRWQRLFATNLGAAAQLSRGLIPGMVRRQKGSIVNIASIWGLRGASCEAAYAASKAALISLTRSLARELGPSGIRVNAVAPGVIRTDMMQEFSADDIRGLEERTPLGRLGEPEEVAQAVAFLLSDRASFISGDCLVVDGGFIV